MGVMPRSREPFDGDEDPPFEVDLHGLRPDDALRRVEREIHTCRVRRVDRLKIITGRGWGNLKQQPILRPKVERWLAGPEGRRLGVLEFEVADDGGSLVVRIRSGGHAAGRNPSPEDGDSPRG
jgi:DNA-nicking Smr family endonuclease